MSRKGCGSQPKRTKPTIRRRVQRWPRGWSSNPRTIGVSRGESMAAAAIGKPAVVAGAGAVAARVWRVEQHSLGPEIHLYLSMRSMKRNSSHHECSLGVIAERHGCSRPRVQYESFPNGLGKSDMMYRFLVPEGVTDHQQERARWMKGGSIVTVPGSSIKLLEPAHAQEQAENNAFMSSFMNASQYFAMPEERRDHAGDRTQGSRRRDRRGLWQDGERRRGNWR